MDCEVFQILPAGMEERRNRLDGDQEGATGLTAYAAKQALLWEKFAEAGMSRFKQEIWDLEFDV